MKQEAEISPIIKSPSFSDKYLNEKLIYRYADYDAVHVDNARERERKKQSKLFEMGCLVCNYFDS